MPHAAESRSQYLSLALFSRQIIEALLELVRTGDRARLSGALPNAIESLQAATDSRSAALSAAASRVATSYDQVRTIDDLFPEDERRRMIDVLRSLQGQGGGPEDEKDRALEAIRFFYRIENRALRSSRQPSPRASRVGRGLCPTH